MISFVVNGYNLQKKPVGIANVVINTINSLPDTESLRIILLVTPLIDDSIIERLTKKNNLEIRILQQKNPLLWLFFNLKKEVNKINPDFLWSPSPLLPFGIKNKIKKIITVNDFVSRDFRSTMTLKGKLITMLLESHTIKKADFLWCISEYTKNRLLELYSNNKKSIFIGCAPDPFIKKVDITEKDRDVLVNNKITKKFLLFVGSLEPRKNLSFLLRVFEQFHHQKDMQLVIVGARTWGDTNLVDIVNKNSFPKDDVIFTPFISESDLRVLYNTASCFVSTSLNEGFGLPQTESMMCECPVVTAHNSAMIEVVENAGITVEGWEIGDWVESINNAINNRESLIEKQNERMKNYNWNIISKELMNFIGVKI